MTVALAVPAMFVLSTIPGVRREAGYNLVLDGYLNNIAYAMAPVICLLRLRSVRGRDRRAGALLALGLAVYGSGNVYWTVIVRTMDPQPFPSGADALFLAFYPLAFVALLLMRGQRDRRLPVSEWLDGLVGGLAVAALAAALVARPLMQAGGGSTWAAVVTTTAYPLLDLVLLLIVVTTLSLFQWRPPVGVWLLAVGLLLFIVADVQYLVATARNAYVSGELNDGLWVTATVIMAASPGWAPKPKGLRLPTWGMLIIPTASACSALALLIEDHSHQLHPIALGLAAATLLLALVRLMATVREVDALAHSRELALTDELTGLGNRRALYELAPARIAKVPPDQQVALLLLDLDRFKEVNDSLGHQAGDAMLQIVASRLMKSIRDPDVTLVRLGGDEFAFLLVGVDVDSATACAADAHDALTAPVSLDGVTVWVGASIGVACMKAADADLTVMLRQADVAMYQAKVDRTSVAVYSPDRDEFGSSDRLETIELLRQAIAARSMVIHYQPKIESSSKRVHGVEALVRWDHPKRGLLYPDAFLGLLEEIGLMRELTHCVLDQALDQLVRWHTVGQHLTVAVNLPASSLVDLELPNRLAGMLQSRDLPAQSLEIEITEEFLMADRDRARDVLGQLRALGIRIAVDDFGTGYSSLAYLKELPVDELKLDKSFLRDIHIDPRAMAIVRSTIGLAHSLGLNLVAEGVEDDRTSARLAESGCDVEQGWFYSKALPADQLDAWLAAHKEPLVAAPPLIPRQAVPSPATPSPAPARP